LAWLVTSQAFFIWMAFPTFNLVRSISAEPAEIGEATRRKAMLRNFKVLSIVLVVIVIASSAYAFAAANTVPATKAGDGAGAISGYTVSAVVYNLNASDPTSLDSVDFTLDAAATNVQIKLVAAGSTWYDCVVDTGNDWTCDTTGATVSSMDELTVIATSN
jgi:hypothetical protein